MQMNTLFLQASLIKNLSFLLFIDLAINILFYFLIFIFVLLIIRFIDSFKYEWYETTGTIVDKLYKPKNSSTDSSVMADGSGGFYITTTSDTEPENWFVLVELDNGDIVKVSDLTPEYYYNVKMGTKVDVCCKIYWLTKTRSEFDIIVDELSDFII